MFVVWSLLHVVVVVVVVVIVVLVVGSHGSGHVCLIDRLIG